MKSVNAISCNHSTSAWHKLCQLAVISGLVWCLLCGVLFLRLSTTPCTTLATHLSLRTTQWQHQERLVRQSPWWQTVTSLVTPLIDTLRNKRNILFDDTAHRYTQSQMRLETVLPQSIASTLHCAIQLGKQQSHLVWHKLKLAIAMLPWCVLAILIGTTEGLIQRYIRTCELGRESTFAFHHISKRLWQIGLLMWWGYWVLGNRTQAHWVLLGFITLIGVIRYQRCARFKKYV